MNEILYLLLWGTTALSNAYELVKFLENYNFQAQDRLISFDVASLFTRVPVDESLKIVEERLEEMSRLTCNPIKEITSLSNAAILRVLRHALSQCYFVWEGDLYKQKAGLPMGGRLSPIIANLYMEVLEHNVQCTVLPIPKI